MLSYAYTITNTYTGKSFGINQNTDSTSPCQTGKGAILQDYPVFELDVRNDERDKSGQHGIWDFFSFYGKRNIAFSGIIVAANLAELVTIQNQMKQVLSLPAQPIAGTYDGYVNISWQDELGNNWNINAKITKDIEFKRTLGHQTRCDFFIEMKADNPWILSTILNDTEEVFAAWPTRMGWRNSQFTMPTFLPNNIDSIYTNKVNIYQKGTAQAPGIYRIYGPAVNPVLTKLNETFSNDMLLANFYSTENWVGGTSDLINYQTGIEARKLTSVNSVQATMSLPGALNLPSNAFINFYFYVDNIDNMKLGDYATGKNYIKFKVDAGNYFIAELSRGNATIRNNWNYFILLKDEFISVGTPSWEDITEIEFSINSVAGTTLNITFADLHDRDIEFTEQQLALNITLSAGQYVDFDVQEGTVERDNGTDYSSYLTLGSAWFYLNPRQNLLFYEDDSTPELTATYPYFYNNPVIETGLVGYYHFDEQNFTDYSASGNNGALATGAENFVQADTLGSTSAWEMDNASYWEAQTPFVASGVQVATISLRTIFSDFSASHYIFSQLFGTANAAALFYDQSTDSLKVTTNLDGVLRTASVTNFSSSYSLNTLYNIIVTFDTTVGITIYIDNVQAGQTLITGAYFNAGFGNMRFGANTAGTIFGKGILDEVRIYDFVLDSSERQMLLDKPYINKYLNQVQVYWYDAIL